MWRVSAHRVFFDVRLRGDSTDDLEAEQRIALGHQWDGHTTVPYLCLAWEGFAKALLALDPGAIFAHGYYGEPSDTVTGVQGKICFATFVLERRTSQTAAPLVCTALPFSWPSGLATTVDLRDPEELERHVPIEVAAQ
jgi:hypothetical protein